VRTIVRDGITALGDCGLSDAQAKLVRAQAARSGITPTG
jgi:RNase P/RNase MRP subunit POP5